MKKRSLLLHVIFFLMICCWYRQGDCQDSTDGFPFLIDYYFNYETIQVNVLDGTGEYFSSPNGIMHDPIVKINNNGETLVYWSFQTEGKIYLTGTTIEDEWLPITEIDTNEFDRFIYMAAIDFNDNGQKILAWAGNKGIYVSLASSELNFSSTMKIADKTGTTYVYGGIDQNGNALLVWTGESIQSCYYSADSGSWSSPETIGDPGGSAAALSFDMSDDGHAALLWQNLTDGEWKLFASNFRFDDSQQGIWNSPVLMNEADVYQNFSIDAEYDGNCVAVWTTKYVTNYRNEGLHSSFYSPETGWGELLILPNVDDSGSSLDPNYPKIDMNTHGDAVVVWVMDRIIYANRFDYNLGWQEPELLQEGQAGDPTIIRPNIDEEGNLLAFWEPESYSSIGPVEFRRYYQSSGWMDVESLSMIETLDGYLSLDFNTLGQGVVGWSEAGLVWDEDRQLYVGLDYNLASSKMDFSRLLDSDGDGMPDRADSFPNDSAEWSDNDLDGTGDNEDPDDDNDGLLDSDEINIYATAPLKADTDGDGISDGGEVNVYGTDPTVPDTDADTDEDGITNVNEIDVYGTDPLETDTDLDGLIDGDEINIYGTDPLNADTDFDGLSDGDEINIYGIDPTVPDVDADTDGDGITNVNEIDVYGTDPNVPDADADSDSDDLTNVDEVDFYGTDPLIADTDGDGISDGDEIDADSDPIVADVKNNDDTSDNGSGSSGSCFISNLF